MTSARRLILAALLLLTGCGGTISPPDRGVFDPTTAYAKVEGRHSSVLLPRGDGSFVEYTYGDWRWFALVRTRFDVAARAMLGSPQATLGRREIAPPPVGQAPDEASGATILPLLVDARRVEALILTLDGRFDRHLDSLHYNHEYGVWFVHDDERYHAFNNCNHLTARWLRQLGCEVRGATLTNDFRLARDAGEQPRTDVAKPAAATHNRSP